MSKIRISLTPTRNEFSQAVEDKFDEIDQKVKRDGFLSKKEIDLALGDPLFFGKYGAMVATLKKHLADFEEFSDDEWGDENDGITRADMTAYDRLRIKNPRKEIIRNIKNMYDYAKGKIQAANKNLFAGPIDPLSVKQGMIGDCWFLAAIVGVANRAPREIRNMIRSLAGDRYEVTFPGISGPIIVTKPTDGEIAVFSSSGANGLWLSVLEKAYGASVNRDAYFFIETSHYDAAGGGEFIGKGIEIMTGHSVDSDDLIDILSHDIELNMLRDKLHTAIQNNKVVTTSIRGNFDFWSDNHYRDNGLPMGHAYTIMDYNINTDIIRIRNPWGWGGVKWPNNWQIIQGVFGMDVPTFWEYFSIVAFEE